MQTCFRIKDMRVAITIFLCTMVVSLHGVGYGISPNRNDVIVQAINRARPSVVNIRGEKLLIQDKTENLESERISPSNVSTGKSQRYVNGMGTGIILDRRGYVVTNYHVIDGVVEIFVTTHDGETFTAGLVARDQETDLAIIKINTQKKFIPIMLGTSRDLMPGETVMAVGNAYGYEHTVTKGIISALHRSVQVNDSQCYEDLVQTDASINPGNSGGPLLNVDGEMIAINAAVRDGAQGIGFAIPVDKVLQVTTRLLEEYISKYNWTGLTLDVSRMEGAVVAAVEKNSPAASSGLKIGDVIQKVEEKRVLSGLDFIQMFLERHTGEKINLEITRKDHVFTTDLVLGSVAGAPTVHVMKSHAALGGKVTSSGIHTFRMSGELREECHAGKDPFRSDKDVLEDLIQDIPGGDSTLELERMSPNIPSVSAGTNNFRKNTAEKMAPSEQRFWEELGLKLEPVTREVFHHNIPAVYKGGLKITEVRSGSVAEEQGLKEGDYLLGILRWETLSLENLAFILNQKEYKNSERARFLLVRDRDVLYGYFSGKNE